MKYQDTKSLGRSLVCPYKEGESASKRHKRRLKTNLNMSEMLNQWCKDHGIEVHRSNGGHHWQLIAGKKIAEWWPSTAKLVFDKNWTRGIHCHDVNKLMSAVGKRWLHI